MAIMHWPSCPTVARQLYEIAVPGRLAQTATPTGGASGGLAPCHPGRQARCQITLPMKCRVHQRSIVMPVMPAMPVTPDVPQSSDLSPPRPYSPPSLNQANSCQSCLAFSLLPSPNPVETLLGAGGRQ